MNLDVVFLSYDEPLADTLCARLAAVLQHPVKRLHGVAGMRRAYRLTAQLVDTPFYLQADGDFQIAVDFDPTWITALPADVAMRVWPARNPVNGLRYGYGGLKLIRTAAMRDLNDDAVDVLAALPGRVQFAPMLGGVTRFNQSPFHAWKAGFRECAMLTRATLTGGCEYGGTDTSARARIATWTAGGSGEFADEAVRGAREGVAYAQATGPDTRAYTGLNDPAWLAHRFTATTQ